MTAWTAEAAWTKTRLPVERADALPAAAYVDEEFFGAERQRVFATSWVGVAIVDEVADGRLLVRSVGDKSIIITRKADGELRAFFNSCRHRGTQLADRDCDIANTIRCPYHRWGYNLDGTLVATPRFDEVEVDDFDRADYPLHRVRVAEWGCLIFACLHRNTAPLEEWLGDLPDRTAGYGLDTWRSVETQTLTLHANWKLIAENFQEYYHVPWIHPELAKVSKVEDHYRYQGPGMYCGQTTVPISTDSRADWMAMPPAADLSPSDTTSGRFISIFPNILLSLLPNHAFVIRLDPMAPDRTIESCTWLVPASTGEVSDHEFAATRKFWIDVNSEDVDIVEKGQRGLSSGGYTPGRLSPRFEEPLNRFHNMLADRFVGLDRIPEGDPTDADPTYGTGANPLPWHPAQ